MNNCTKINSGGRLEFLDGIRGNMALNVIISHFILVYFPQMYFENYADKAGDFLSLFAKTPLSIFVNGNIAVQFFFVLTGFLVCKSVVCKKDLTESPLLVKSVNRYLRLFTVAAAAILFTFITMVCKLQFHQQASEYTSNTTFLLNYCNFTPTIKNLLNDIILRPYLTNSVYVGPLWTIKYELWGYIICYLLCVNLKNSKWRRLAYVITAIIIGTQLDMNYVAFIMGVFLADIVFVNEDKTTILSKLYYKLLNNKLIIILIGIVGLYFACCPMYFCSIYSFLEKIPYFTTGLSRAVGISMLLYFVINSEFFTRIFSCKLFIWLGKISYSTYAFHWPIMLCLQSGLFILFIGYMQYTIAALLAFAITLPVIYLISYLSWKLFEDKYYLSVDKISCFVVNVKNKLTRKENRNGIE